jgi:hypothetical protein
MAEEKDTGEPVVSETNFGQEAYSVLINGLSNATREIIEKIPEGEDGPSLSDICGSVFVDPIHLKRVMEKEQGVFVEEPLPAFYIPSADSGMKIFSDKAAWSGERLLSSYSAFCGNRTNQNRSLEAFGSTISKAYPKPLFDGFVLLPDLLDEFNRPIRERCNALFAVPNSIGATYGLLSEKRLDITQNYRLFIIDLDGDEASVIETEIGHEISKKSRKNDIKITRFGYRDFAGATVFSFADASKFYISQYCQKYKIPQISGDVLDSIVELRLVEKLLRTRKTIVIKTHDSYVALAYDYYIHNTLANAIRNSYSSIKAKVISHLSDFDDGSSYSPKFFLISDVVSSLGLNGTDIVSSADLVNGCYFVQFRKKAGQSLWFEHLPRLFLEVLDRKAGLPHFVSLIPDSEKDQEVLSSLDSAREFAVPGIVIVQKGHDKIDLQLDRLVFGKSNKPKKASFQNSGDVKCFPLSEDVPTKMSLTYRYGAPNPFLLKLTAIDQENSPFNTITNTWEDADRITPRFSEVDGSVEEDSTDTMNKNIDFLRQVFVPDLERCLSDSSFLKRRSQPSPDDRFHRECVLFYRVNTRMHFYWQRMLNYRVYKNHPGVLSSFFVNPIDSSLISIMRTFVEFGSHWPNEYSRYQPLDEKMFEDNFREFIGYFANIPLLKTLSSVVRDLQDKTIQIMKDGGSQGFHSQIPFTRCIANYSDDKWGFFDEITRQGMLYVRNEKMLLFFARTISSYGWFEPGWIYCLYDAKNGANVIRSLIRVCSEKVNEWAKGLKKGMKINGSEVRDTLEALLCFTRVRLKDPTILDPNDNEVKLLIWNIEDIAVILQTNPDVFACESGTDTKSSYKPRVHFPGEDCSKSLMLPTVLALRNALRGTESITLSFNL